MSCRIFTQPRSLFYAARRRSTLQLGPVGELLQRLGVRERLAVLHGAPMHDVPHGQLHYFPTLRPWDVRHLEDSGWDVPGRGIRADLRADPLYFAVVQRQSFAQLDEEHDPLVAAPLLPYHQALDDFRQLFHLAINLCGSDAYSPWIQHRIGSSVDDYAVVLRQLHVIAVRPHAREAFEVGGAIFPAVRIVPESDRHRWKRHRAHELTLLAADRMTLLVENLHLHAECAALDLATPYRRDGIPTDETAHDVRPAGDRRQMNVALDVRVHEVETLRRQRRSGRRHRPHRRQGMRLRRAKSRLRDGVDVFCGRAEERHSGLVRKIEENVAIRMERRTIEQQNRRAGCERGDQPVPHHPAERREVEHAVARMNVAMELVLFQVLDQRAARTVDDALRNTGSTGRIEDVQRMVEWQRVVRQLRAAVRREKVLPAVSVDDGVLD